MDREKNIKLNGKKMTVIEFTVQKLQIFEYLIFGVFPEIVQEHFIVLEWHHEWIKTKSKVITVYLKYYEYKYFKGIFEKNMFLHSCVLCVCVLT